MSYLLVILLLGLLILVHELGHFVAARWSGIDVARFSIGFGPKLWAVHRGQTEYWLSAIPLGGYVMPAIENEQQFFAIPLHKRMWFAIGGPAANLLFAVLGFVVLAAVAGNWTLHGLLVEPVWRTMQLTAMVTLAIPALFAQPEHLSSVLGIVSSGSDYVGMNAARALQFVIMLSVNLAVFNMLPLPVLDGGKILLGLVEKVYPKATRAFVPLTVAAALLLLGLILYATALDLGRLFA